MHKKESRKNKNIVIFLIAFIVIKIVLDSLISESNIYISEYIGDTLVAIIIIIVLILIIFKKKYIINPDNALDYSAGKFIEKHIKIVDIIARMCILTFILIAFLFVILPAILDLPYLIKGEFKTINCVTLSSSDYGTLDEKRSIEVKNIDTNEIIYLEVKYTPIEMNEYFTIEYLPNTEVGRIINRIK